MGASEKLTTPQTQSAYVSLQSFFKGNCVGKIFVLRITSERARRETNFRKRSLSSNKCWNPSRISPSLDLESSIPIKLYLRPLIFIFGLHHGKILSWLPVIHRGLVSFPWIMYSRFMAEAALVCLIITLSQIPIMYVEVT